MNDNLFISEEHKQLLSITQEELDKSFNKEIEKNKKINKLSNSLLVAAIPLTFIEFIVIDYLTDNFALHLLFFAICFFVNFIILFSIPMTVTIKNTKNDLKAIDPDSGKLKSGIRFSIRNREYIKQRSNDLCSDYILSETENKIRNAQGSYEKFSFILTKAYIMLYRGDRQGSEETVNEIDTIFDPKIHHLSDPVFLKLNKAIVFEEDEYFLNQLKENVRYIENLKKQSFEHTLNYCILAATECRLMKNYEKAIEYLDLRQEYYFKKRNSSANPSAVKETNQTLYSLASICLDISYMCLKIGNYDRCRNELKNADYMIGRLSCPIPVCFTSQHKKVIEELNFCSQELSS